MATARLIHEHELDELLSLYQMLNPDDPELERTEELRSQWQEMLRDEYLKLVVVEHDDRLVASCVLSITPEPDEKRTTVRTHRERGHTRGLPPERIWQALFTDGN